MRDYLPIIVKKSSISQQALEVLGPVTEIPEGWRLEYNASVRYSGDDETAMFAFMHALAEHDLPIGLNDVVKFCWDEVKAVSLPLP